MRSCHNDQNGKPNICTDVVNIIDGKKYIISTVPWPSGNWQTAVFENEISLNDSGVYIHFDPLKPLRGVYSQTFEEAEKRHFETEEMVVNLPREKWNFLEAARKSIEKEGGPASEIFKKWEKENREELNKLMKEKIKNQKGFIQILIIIIALIIVALVVFSHKQGIPQPQTQQNRIINTFHGYDCKGNCSGHEAGYQWAERRNITNEDYCTGKSISFIEGCRVYVEENR